MEVSWSLFVQLLFGRRKIFLFATSTFYAVIHFAVKKKEIEFVDTFKRLSDQSKGVERGIVEDVKRSKGNDG